MYEFSGTISETEKLKGLLNFLHGEGINSRMLADKSTELGFYLDASAIERIKKGGTRKAKIDKGQSLLKTITHAYFREYSEYFNKIDSVRAIEFGVFDNKKSEELILNGLDANYVLYSCLEGYFEKKLIIQSMLKIGTSGDLITASVSHRHISGFGIPPRSEEFSGFLYSIKETLVFNLIENETEEFKTVLVSDVEQYRSTIISMYGKLLRVNGSGVFYSPCLIIKDDREIRNSIVERKDIPASVAETVFDYLYGV